MQTITELVLSFLKIGALNIGGGYAMIPFLQSEVLSRNWLTLSEFTDIVAISQITPGPLAVNMATFIGYRQALLPGALVASFAVCLPSFIMMLILVKSFLKFGESSIAKNMLNILRPTVMGLIFAATLLIAQLVFFTDKPTSSIFAIDIKSLLLSLACFIAMYCFKASSIFCIILAGCLGIFLF